MVDAGLMQRIIEAAKGEHKFAKEMYAGDVFAADGVEDGEILVNEGSSVKKLPVEVANFMSLGLHHPEWLLQRLHSEGYREDPPNVVESVKSYDNYDGWTRGYAKWLAEVAADLDPRHDRDPERYEYGLYHFLVKTDADLNVGTNPFHTHTFYVRQGPVLLTTDDPDAGEVVETNSAADW